MDERDKLAEISVRLDRIHSRLDQDRAQTKTGSKASRNRRSFVRRIADEVALIWLAVRAVLRARELFGSDAGDQARTAMLAAAVRRNSMDQTVPTAQAVAEIRELARGRNDLLVACAHFALAEAEVSRRMADLCIAAGADESRVEDWIAVERALADLRSDRRDRAPGFQEI